jgi:2-keto-3-deoxy-L-fuconate dehydrogenase
MNDFDGLIAVVTGGSGGIGAATVDLLARRGAIPVILDHAPPASDHAYITCDLTRDEDIVSAIGAVDREHGRIDVLVNNAGVGAQGDVGSNDRSEWRRVLDVNVVASARVTTAALPLLRSSTHSAVVNVSSIVAAIGVRNRVLYSATKGAVNAMTLAMAADLVGQGVRVNAVMPGTTDTPWIGRLLESADNPDNEAQALRARQPLGRLVTPDEVAHAIAYLASPLSASTTGTLLSVDGGMGALRVS